MVHACTAYRYLFHRCRQIFFSSFLVLFFFLVRIVVLRILGKYKLSNFVKINLMHAATVSKQALCDNNGNAERKENLHGSQVRSV